MQSKSATRTNRVCWCSRPVQIARDHLCLQCGEHCEIERYRRGLQKIDPRRHGLTTWGDDGA
jgi:hypothetical protein